MSQSAKAKAKALVEKIKSLPGGWAGAVKGFLGVDQVNGSEGLGIDLTGGDLVPQGVGTKNCHEAHSVILSSLVDTSKGLVEIGELSDNGLGYRDLKGLRVVTDEGWKDVPQSYSSGKQKTVKIKTMRGFELEGTGHHRVRRADYEWNYLSDLKVGEKVIVQLGCDWPAEDPLILHVPYEYERQAINPVELPSRLNEIWAELLGWWVAEGGYSTQTSSWGVINSVQFTLHGEDRPRVKFLLDSLRIKWGERQEKGKDDTWTVWVYNRDLGIWFHETLGLEGQAVNKKVPWPIMQGTRSIVLAFMSGISSGDGCSKKTGVIVNSTSSKVLASQLLQLWRRIGVAASVHYYKDERDPRSLYETGRKEIAAGLALKEGRKLSGTYQLQTQKRWTPLVLRILDLAEAKREKLMKHSPGVNFPDTAEILNYRSTFKNQQDTKLRFWDVEKALNGGVCGQMEDTIVSVEEGEAIVKDLVVPSNNTYTTNGFISHNTQGRWRERTLDNIREAAEVAIRKQGASMASFYCAVGETRVLTSNGVKRLDELEEVNLGEETILTEYGPKSYLGCTNLGKKDVYRVTTQTRNNLFVSENHRFRILNDQGILEWKQVKDLKEGDYLLSQRGDKGILPECKGEEEDFWYAIGHLIGDGSRQPDSWNGGEKLTWLAPVGEEESLERIKKFLKNRKLQIWESRQKLRETEERKGTRDLLVVMTKCREITKILGPFQEGGNWRNGGLPSLIWTQGKRQMASLLRGLFTTDGGTHESERQISFTTKRRKLAQDVKFLANLLGVVTTIHSSVQQTDWGVNRKYQLYVTGEESREIFQEKIGFELTRKQNSLRRILCKGTNQEKTGIPNLKEIITRIFPLRTHLFNATNAVKSAVITLRTGDMKILTRRKAEEIIRVAEECGKDDAALALLKEYSLNDWWFDRVVKVRPWYWKREVYDPVSTGTASYVSEGVCSHNSLTWSLYSQIYSLLLWSYERFGNTNLISQRADQASADPEFFKYQNKQGENHCVSGDCWVRTKDDFKRIRDLQASDMILTHKGYKSFDGLWKKGDGKLVRVQTVSGTSILATRDHQLLQRDEWVPIESLTLKDTIAVVSFDTKQLRYEQVSIIQELTQMGEVYDLKNVKDVSCFVAAEEPGGSGILAKNCTVGVEGSLIGTASVLTRQGLKHIEDLQIGDEVRSPELNTKIRHLGEPLFTHFLPESTLKFAKRFYTNTILDSEEFLVFWASAFGYGSSARMQLYRYKNNIQQLLIDRLADELSVKTRSFYNDRNTSMQFNSKTMVELLPLLYDDAFVHNLLENASRDDRWSLLLRAALMFVPALGEKDDKVRITASLNGKTNHLLKRMTIDQIRHVFPEAEIQSNGVWVSEDQFEKLIQDLDCLKPTKLEEDSYSRVTQILDEGKKRVLRITLNNGTSLDLTEDHRVATWEGFKSAKLLEMGDAVQFVAQEGKLRSTFLMGHPRPSILDISPMAEFIGYLTADGNINREWGQLYIYISEVDRDVIDYFKSFLEDWGFHVNVEYRPQDSDYRFTFAAKALVEELRNMGFDGQCIPLSFREAPLAWQASFLRGFTEGDGGVEARELINDDPSVHVSLSQSLKGKNPILIHQIVEMFRQQGVTVSFNRKQQTSSKRGEPAFTYTTITGEYKEYDCYPWLGEINIIGEGKKVFLERIGFISKRKRDVLVNTRQSSRKPTAPNHILHIEELPDLRPCYDIKLEGRPWFDANGIVVHNCSQRMRNYLNKSLSTEQFQRMVHNAAWAGYSSIKMFMILSLSGDSRIPTEKGFLTLRDLWERGQKVLLTKDFRMEEDGRWVESRLLDASVVSDRGMKNAALVVKKAPLKTIKVTTTKGYSYIGSPGHRVRVIDFSEEGDPVYAWRHTQDLKLGDQIALFDGPSLFSNQVQPLVLKEIPLLKFVPGGFENQHQQMPTEWNEDFARIMGAWVGDGGVAAVRETSGTITLGSNAKSTEEQQYIKSLIERVGWNYTVSISNGHPVFNISGYEIARLIHTFGLKNGASSKFVPEPIFSAAEKVIWAFLQGYFAADGTVDDAEQARFNTTSANLSRDIQQLLLGLGVVTSRHRYENIPFGKGTTKALRLADPNHGEAEDIWHVIVIAWNASKFREGIKGTLESKWLRLREETNRRPPYRGLQEALEKAMVPEEYPVVEGRMSREERSKAKRLLGRGYNNYLKVNISLHREQLGTLRKSGVELIRDCPWESVIFDEVISMEEMGEEELYCLVVPEGQTYIADGFVHHNTGMETPEDMQEFCDLLRGLHADIKDIAKQRSKRDGKKPGDEYNPVRLAPSFMLLLCHPHCVQQRTYVNSSTTGLRRIEELASHEEAYRSTNEWIHTPEGSKQASHTYNGGFQPTLRIRTKFGFELEATPNHRIRIITTRYVDKRIDSEGEYVWKRMDELAVGDWAVIDTTNTFPVSNPEIPWDTEAFRKTLYRAGNLRRDIDFPKTLNEEWAELLGWLISDGCIDDYPAQIRFIVTPGYQEARVRELARSLALPEFKAYENKGTQELRINSKELVAWLKSMGCREKAWEKQTPEPILQGTKSIILAYLKGLLGGDGNTHKGQIGLTTTSPILAEETQQILRSVGFISSRCLQKQKGRISVIKTGKYKGTVITAKRDGYTVSVTKEYAAQFLTLCPLKGENFERLYHNPQLTVAGDQKRTTKVGDRFVVQIKSIVPSVAHVMDFVQPETKTFVGNGFICHNTSLQWAPCTSSFNLESETLRPVVDCTRECVAKGSRLLTDKGIKKIEDIQYERVLSEYGGVDHEGLVPKGRRNILRLRTRTGSDLKLTPDHQLRVLDDCCRLVWRSVNFLQVGDRILSRRGGFELLPKNQGYPESFWYCVGHLYGDGYRIKNEGRYYCVWQFTEEESYLRDRIQENLWQSGILSVKREEAADSHGGVNRTQKKLLLSCRSDLLESLLPDFDHKGFWRSKGVPEILWSQGRCQISAFLSGLITSDGGVDRKSGQIQYSTKYRVLRNHVRDLLLIFGVVGTVSKKAQKTPFGITRAWQFRTIGVKSKINFRINVGFGLDSKRQLLDAVIEQREGSTAERFLGLPRCSELVRRLFPGGRYQVPRDENDGCWVRIRSLRKRDGFLTEGMLLRVLERASKTPEGDQDKALLIDILENGWFFDEVKKITDDGEEEVFDLQNTDTHSYVIQGLVNHNCGFGFRTALTRDRVRHSQWSCMAGREGTRILAEAGLRTNYVNYGPVSEEVVWCMLQIFKELGLDWLYWFREKSWHHLFPADAVCTPMDRHYLWEQWLNIRRYVGNSYCSPKGSMVTMSCGTVCPIENIKVGDKVITHKGRARVVTQVHKRWVKENLLRIKHHNGFKDLLVTREHNLFSCPAADFLIREGRDGRRNDLQEQDFSWIPAGEIEVRDALHTPIMEEQLRAIRQGESWSVASSIATEVASIKEEFYEGEVYHLSVEEDHSYIVEGVSHENCLKTSVNPNPKCSSCGACGTASDRKEMLTRKIEDSSKLTGKEAARRDMTSRKKVRFDVDVFDETKRTAPKDILSRELVRAMMLAASEEKPKGLGFDNTIVRSYLKIDQHSLKSAEAMNVQPWVGGRVLVDFSFNKNWPDELLRKLLSNMNNYMWGMRVNDFVASDKLVSLDHRCYGLYTVEFPISLEDLRISLEKFDEAESIKFKQKINIAKDVMRTEEVVRLRSEVLPMALCQVTNKPGFNRLTYMCQLTVNPVQILLTLTAKPPRLIRPYFIKCLGVYQPTEDTEDDIFAILEDRETICQATGQPIEIDVFSGERYRSISAPNLCLAADLKKAMHMREQGVSVAIHGVTR